MHKLMTWATGRNILVLLALFLLFNFVLVPILYPKFQTLDLLTSYTPAEAYQLLTSYGPEGRQSYLIAELTLDLFYPLISGLLFSFLIIYAFQRGFPGQRWIGWLALIPLAGMTADYLENICVVTMLLSYPRQLDLAAAISNFFTQIKLLFAWAGLIFIVGFIAWPFRVMLERRTIKSHASH